MPMLPTMAIGLNSRTEATGGGMALTLTGTLTICGLSQGPMRYTRVTITSPGENRFEQEAYNPSAGTSCDRLKVRKVDAGDPPTWTLPITHYSIYNGCGSSSIKELVHLELDENSISTGVWYRHRVTYEKQAPGSGGDGEVNYSFTHNRTWRDNWLGKVVYDQWFNKKYSDPSGLVN